MLPVRQIQSQILAALSAANRLVLCAPTGSGKTTQVPQMLLDSPAITGQIIVLQPRRLATRMVARRVAQEMQVPLGSLVGYQTRHESAISDDTRIRFITEGLMLRLLQSAPALSGVGAVVLDEFHERNLDADLSLGLLRRIQETHRPDLRLLVMSATLDVQAVAGYLQCEAIEATGRTFPVTISHLPRWSGDAPWDLAAAALVELVDTQPHGDVLIFMPGGYEIRRTIEACQRRVGGGDMVYLPLHGSLPVEQQDAAVSTDRQGRRKVVVSTNVAETSITIPGIHHVIDSGLARVHRFDPRRGLDVLELTGISQASADQRAGRAGRTAPGSCRRLWTASDHRQRAAQQTPEIHRVDMAGPLLQMIDAKVGDVRLFPWIDPPEAAAVERGLNLLRMLGAIDDQERLTATGRLMARFPAHPRLSRMLVEAAERRCLGRAAVWAALIGERDLIIGAPRPMFMQVEGDEPASDLVVLERALSAAVAARFHPSACGDIGVHANTAREIDRTHRQFIDLARRLKLDVGKADGGGGGERTEDLIRCLLVAFGDQVAVRREAGREDCAMVGHKRVVLDGASVVRRAGPMVVLEVREIAGRGGAQTVLSLASEVKGEWLAEMYPERMNTVKQTAWDESRRAVMELEQRRYGELVISERARPVGEEAGGSAVLAERIVAGELKLAKWDEAVEQWIERVRCVRQWYPERGLIGYEADEVAVIVHEIVGDAVRWSQVEDRAVLDAVRGALGWEDQQFVEKMAPAEVRLPSGYAMKMEYSVTGPPRGRAKIQQLYGLEKTPTVAGGRVRLVLEILGPNYRPVQVTDDLASFWANMYPELRKELKRRYPRHEWR
jgi:ATP-dependent helicase HrpB